MRMSRRALLVPVLLVVMVLLGPIYPGPTPPTAAQSMIDQSAGVQAVQLRRVTATGGSPAAKLSAQELQAVLEHVYQMRTQQAAQIPVMVGPAELPAPPTPEVLLSPEVQSAPRQSGTQIASGPRPTGTDETKLVRQTRTDPEANDPLLASTLAEPVAANNGRDIFMAG